MHRYQSWRPGGRDHPARAAGRAGRARRGLALAVLSASVLSACNVWEQLGHGPGNDRFNPDETAITPGNVGGLRRVWSSAVADDYSEPILSGDTLYTTVSTDERGSVRAYRADTGAIAWETTLPAPANPRWPGPVVLAGGALWASHGGSGASSCSAVLTRLDPATGAVLGTETTGAAVVDAVVAAGTTTAFTTRGGCAQTDGRPQLVVRDAAGPAGGWTHRFPAGDGNPPTAPSIGGGRLVVALGDEVHAFDAAGCGAATCEPVWVAALDQEGVDVSHAESRPIVGADGTVYVGAATPTGDTVALALDGATGAPLWRTDTHSSPGSGWQNLALAHGRLYVSDHRHSSSVGGAVEAFPAAGCGAAVCTPAWSASVDGPPVAGLSVGGDTLYLGAYDGDDTLIVAFDARGCGTATCAPLASVGFGAEQPVRVAVADGRVAVVASAWAGQTLHVLAPSR